MSQRDMSMFQRHMSMFQKHMSMSWQDMSMSQRNMFMSHRDMSMSHKHMSMCQRDMFLSKKNIVFLKMSHHVNHVRRNTLLCWEIHLTTLTTSAYGSPARVEKQEMKYQEALPSSVLKSNDFANASPDAPADISLTSFIKGPLISFQRSRFVSDFLNLFTYIP